MTHRRIVTRQRVVRGKTRLIQENRLIVHRIHTIVRDVLLHKVNRIKKYVTSIPGRWSTCAAAAPSATRWRGAKCAV